MTQNEADRIAIELLNLYESFGATGKDKTYVIASSAAECIRRIKNDHPMIADSMNELEILREEARDK